jgi:glycosyltransferase involved in cell wall biosynthesis
MRLATRVFALTHEPVIEGDGYNRLGHLVPALDRRLHVAGYATPDVSRAVDLALKARHVHPDRIAWRERAWVNTVRFERRGDAAEAELARHAGEYDAILQVQAMFGLGSRPAPYAVYTDNVLALTRRHYPESSRLTESQARRFMEMEAEHCRGAAALFPWSEFVGRSMVEDYGCDPARVFVIPAAPKYAPLPLEGRRWGSHAALFVGFDFERKGGLELLAAWPRVRRELPEARLRIVGPPKQRWSLPAGVEWIGSLDDGDRLARLYSESDVLAMPARYEAWGFTFQEAMAHGTACLSGDVGAQPELVREGISGRNVPVGDVDALVEALVAVLTDASLAEALGRGGWNQVREAATWDVVAERMAPRLAAIAA